MMTEAQFDLIKKVLNSVGTTSGFYRKKFEGIDLASVKTQEDFEKLPFSDKEDLRDAYQYSRKDKHKESA